MRASIGVKFRYGDLENSVPNNPARLAAQRGGGGAKLILSERGREWRDKG